MNYEGHDRDADARVGDIECGPGVRERDMQIDQQEIDDVAVEETIGEISHNAGQEQGERDVAQCVGGPPSQEQGQNNTERDTREDDEKGVVVPKRPEGRAGVGHVHEAKKIGDNKMPLLCLNVAEHPPFRDLIQGVERERQEKDESHW